MRCFSSFPRRAASALAGRPLAPRFALLLQAAEARALSAEHELAAYKKYAELAASIARDKDALLASKDALRASIARDKDALVAALLASKDELFVAAAKAHAIALANSMHETDVAKSRLNVRAILEVSIAEAFASWRSSHDDAKTTSDRLLKLLDAKTGCAGYKAYVRVAAVDNGVPPDDAIKEARKLYSSFCSRAHADAPEGSAGISSVVFESAGRTALVAYAAAVHYTGRRLRLYAADDVGATLPLKMRTLHDCDATEAAVRTSPLLEG